MIYTNPIPFVDLEHLLSNIPTYFSNFATDKVIVIRGANLSHEDQERVSIAIGDYFNIYPNSKISVIHRYTENHERNNKFKVAKNDDVGLAWHTEHPYYTNPIILATWNNLKFTCDEDSGKTYFYDGRELYNSLPEEWKTFLSKCEAKGVWLQKDSKELPAPVVLPHWLTNEPTLRPIFKSHTPATIGEALYYFDGRKPTLEENEKYQDILKEVAKKVYFDEENRIVHKWQQGDLVIPDMFSLIHAVTGGFLPEERLFTGVWSYKQDNTGGDR